MSQGPILLDFSNRDKYSELIMEHKEEKKKYTCAWCGEKRELTRSSRDNGIQQPKPCVECLVKYLRGETEPYDLFWIKQLTEAGDKESLDRLMEQCLDF